MTVLALAPVLGLFMLAGATSFTGDPSVFILAGLAVFGAILLLGLLLCVPRPARPLWRWVRGALVLGTAGLAVWQVSAAVLTPPPLPGALRPVPGQATWSLPTGSELAYVRLAPRGQARPEPVVVVQGVPDLGGDAAVFAGLADRTVYLYDRLGTGRSARLADPSGYTAARDVADLEAVRQAIGAERMIVLGHSAGAEVATAYATAFPDRVAKLVLSSPTPAASAVRFAGLDTTQSRRLALSLLHPRSLAIDTLAQVDPAAARAFASDAELDARLDARNALVAPALSCPGASPYRPRGAGGLAALSRRPAPLLRAEPAVPTLVIRGACDPAPPLGRFASARRVEVPGAGHHVYRDRREPYLKAVNEFLAG
ncbi:alpha/beta fold hydrolase [Nonomuraea sp. NPDC050328]|uniref:alpha/beta fold hydrolase n=1 Tax=Nonomuraea sp. NPDC050328 TaxID=3364361 RepID=UPI0037B36764